MKIIIIFIIGIIFILAGIFKWYYILGLMCTKIDFSSSEIGIVVVRILSIISGLCCIYGAMEMLKGV